MPRRSAVIFGLAFVAVSCAAVLIAYFATVLLRETELSQAPGEATVVFAPAMVSPLPEPQEEQEVTLGNWTYRFRLISKGLAAGRAPLIDDFLPDSQTLSVLLWKNPDYPANQEVVALLDATTASLTPYGARRPTFVPSALIWLEDVRQVAFLKKDTREELAESANYALVIGSNEESSSTSEITVGNATAIAGRDAEIVLLDRDTGSVVLIDSRSGSRTVLVDDVRKYGLKPETDDLLQIQMHPNAPLAFLFGDSGSILIDIAAKQASVLSLGEDQTEQYYGPRWALDAAWNPHNPELALIIGVGMPSLPSSRLFVLDAPSGRLVHHPIPVRWVTDTAWAPNGEHLLVLGVDQPGTGNSLWLLDTVSGEFANLAFDIGASTPGASGWSVAWSPDGQYIAIVQGDGIQLLHVESTKG